MTQTTIDVKSRTPSASFERNCVRRLPYTIEHIVTPEDGYEFEWSGSSAYLALHDIVLKDGTMAGDLAPTSQLDMRTRLTFLPRGVRVSGWGEPARRGNSFTALYFDQDWLLDELETAPNDRDLQPAIYFQNKHLLHCLSRLGDVARAHTPAPKIMTDSLAVMAGVELMRSQVATQLDGAGLTSLQISAVRDFVIAHIADDVSVADLAAIVGQSVFHFTRQFKKTTGASPYRFVLETRVERAKQIMLDNTLSLSEVAQMAGFGSASQFSKIFSGIVGITPRAFRQTSR
ncbi:MAG: helix-turn-helix transcriptional regulator [Hyphomonadaceae bacterium]|nr:helix-turn-helix transcriptional regulator [Hyphomonadaceae bacterium]